LNEVIVPFEMALAMPDRSIVVIPEIIELVGLEQLVQVIRNIFLAGQIRECKKNCVNLLE
jgi:hypothetical protein